MELLFVLFLEHDCGATHCTRFLGSMSECSAEVDRLAERHVRWADNGFKIRDRLLKDNAHTFVEGSIPVIRGVGTLESWYHDGSTWVAAPAL